jgi:hypothetical protein
MPICKLCDREFFQCEINSGIEVQHAGSSRVKLVRFQNGDLHQFKVEKKQNPRLVPKGTFIIAKPIAPIAESAPKSIQEAVEHPLDEVVPIIATPEAPAEQAQDVEAMARNLAAHFHPNPEPENVIVANTADTDDDSADDDGLTECVVVWLKLEDSLGRPPIGLARPGNAELGSRCGYFFKFSEIISQGEEFIKLGTRLRGRILPPKPGTHSERLVDMEVYRD